MRAAPEPLGSPCDAAAAGALDPAARVLVICENRQRALVIAPGNRGSFCAFVGGSRPSALCVLVLPILHRPAGACL
jgi:hypothetical protein